MTKLFLLTSLVIVFLGCNSQNHTTQIKKKQEPASTTETETQQESKSAAKNNKKASPPELKARSIYKLKPIRSFGNNDHDNYVFIKIRDVKFGTNKNIYVADFKGYFLAKYSFNGKHIIRTGKQGQGPKEFLSLQSIAIANNKIYTHDPRNRRISIYDQDLKYIKAFKVPMQINRLLHATPKGKIVTVNYGARGLSGLGRVALLNKRMEIYRSFFNRHWFGEYKIGKQRDEFIKHRGTIVRADYSPADDRTLIGFKTSKNPVDIFLLNKAGSIEHTFTYRADPAYQLPEFLYNQEVEKKIFGSQNTKAAESNDICLDSMLIYKNKYLVFLKYQRAGVFHTDTHKHLFLVFDKTGLISKTVLDNDLTFFDVSEDGYLVAADVEAEIPTVQIFKIASAGV